MQPMATIRQWQTDQLRHALTTLECMIAGIPPGMINTARDGGEGWTILEVLGHLRDFEEVFIERLRITLAEDTPELSLPDPAALAIERGYNDEEPMAVLAAWQAHRQTYLALCLAMEEAQWERPARHPRRGIISVDDQVFLTVWHDMNHLEQIAHIRLAG